MKLNKYSKLQAAIANMTQLVGCVATAKSIAQSEDHEAQLQIEKLGCSGINKQGIYTIYKALKTITPYDYQILHREHQAIRGTK